MISYLQALTVGLIFIVFGAVVWGLVTAIKKRQPFGPTEMVQARFLSAKVMGGPASIQDRGRVASGNSYVRVAFKRLSFWCEELEKELHFTVKEDYPVSWKEGDEGVLTFAKKKFVSFR